MNSGYHKNLVFTAACIGMCFFGVSMITLGSVLPSLVTKLELSGLQTTSLVTFLPIGMLAGSLIFGPIADRFGHKALLVPSCIIVLSGLEGLIFFESIPLLQISIVGIGLGGGILNGETNALVSDISGESEKGSRISFLGVFYGLGALGIPSLLGILSEHYSFETILQGIGIIMLAGILFCIPIRFPAPKQAQGFPVKEGLGLLKESSLLLLSFILFFQSGIEGGKGAPLQSCPHCNRLCPADSGSRFHTGCCGNGCNRNGIIVYLSGYPEYSRNPLPFIVGNGIRHSSRHRPYRTNCHERTDGNGFHI